jgi:hypothetical protein
MSVNVLKVQDIRAQMGVINVPSSLKSLLPLGLSRRSHAQEAISKVFL